MNRMSAAKAKNAKRGRIAFARKASKLLADHERPMDVGACIQDGRLDLGELSAGPHADNPHYGGNARVS